MLKKSLQKTVALALQSHRTQIEIRHELNVEQSSRRQLTHAGDRNIARAHQLVLVCEEQQVKIRRFGDVAAFNVGVHPLPTSDACVDIDTALESLWPSLEASLSATKGRFERC